MRSVSFSDGIIVEMPGSEANVRLPDGSERTVFTRCAVAIRTNLPGDSNGIICGSSGWGLSDDEAWRQAVLEIQRQLERSPALRGSP